MKFNRFLLFFLLLFSIIGFFSSCEKKTQIFEREGLVFILPESWTIDEIDSTEANFFYMSIGKKGYGASADVFIEWNLGKIPLDTVMNILKQNYQNEKAFKDGGIKFSESKMDKYGKFDALTATFEAKLLDVNHSGKIHCFYLQECNKTVMIAYLQVSADIEKQKDDFEIIENSFHCK